MTNTSDTPEPTVAQKIKAALAERPYLNAAHVAERIGHTERVVTVVASREGIRFMSRREIEDWIEREMFCR